MEIDKLKSTGGYFAKTQIIYRGYAIHKKPFPPSIIFYILKDREIHVLRVLREEKAWKQILERKIEYTYPPEIAMFYCHFTANLLQSNNSI